MSCAIYSKQDASFKLYKMQKKDQANTKDTPK
jgi:hypothetical protein